LTGWTFPPMPPPERGPMSFLDGPALVRQSIRLILETEPGERVMRPTFGCGLRRYLMEPNTPSTRAGVGRDVEAALRAWEPRIDLRQVDVATTQDPSEIVVTISYEHVRDRTPAVLQVPVVLGGAVTGAGS
ncbi:MAG TPA: GPW/gp25 family protein, partial [Actinomycetota bacterium]|nr:GPW/gp25 family protein [Actinomycetota bacterium]